MTMQLRAYRHEQDYHRMRHLASENQADADMSPYPTTGDLDFRRYLENVPQSIYDTRLWDDGTGNLLGFVWSSADDSLIVCHHQHRGLEEAMIEWVEQMLQLEQAASDLPLCPSLYAFDRDDLGMDILRRRGYERTEGYVYCGIRYLASPVPPPRLPTGYTLDNLRAGDIAQRASLHALAAGGRTVTPGQYQLMMASAPTYRQELDLVCRAPDGELAAFCTAWFDEKSRHGLFEPYGCHPEHRRRGLATAILSEGLKRLNSLGAMNVSVARGGCRSDDLNPDPALILLAKIGFEPDGRDYLWRRCSQG
jgi:mycothiol synthase